MKNKYIKYIVIFIIILSFTYYLYFDKKKIKDEIDNDKLINSMPYLTPDIIVKQSNIKNSGRGVFSTRAYTIGEIIEVCPCIKQEYKYAKGEISKYVYDYNQKYCIIALGFCSIYNHKDDPNAKWTIINTEQIKMVALKNIRQGEEIFISYGSDYFKNHGITMK